ncbi:hypothetical protein TBR22_A36190 [Luteitalea sp. TBR-22]|nr:hypothetical protein TBR22_A36190 [Luteitalea sp. TBR-22]
MHRVAVGGLLVVALVSAISAQSRNAVAPSLASSAAASATPGSRPSPASRVPTPDSRVPTPDSRLPTPVHRAAATLDPSAAAATFREFCVDCHGTSKPKGGISIEGLLEKMTVEDVGAHWEEWQRIADRIELREMPPADEDPLPTDAQREVALAWIRGALAQYDARHAGEPGRVTVRRLTSAEYAYAIHDLTGIDVKTGVDASSDAVGGEGFANFGDVQFVQDTTVERYLEAARQVAEHAVIGAGPLGFYEDPGKTGLELSALSRIEGLYAAHGFRVVSGEGGRPFGFDRYGKAFYVAWHYRHRAALGEPTMTLRALAAREGITGRFAEHVASVVARPTAGYPASLTIDRWRRLPAPGTDRAASIAAARAECDAMTTALVTWPSWFFARGDLAAGGQGDENPLVFDDTTLGVESRHAWTHALNRRPGRATSRIPGPWTVHLAVDALRAPGTAAPVVIWRDARVVLRTPPPAPKPDDTPAIIRARQPGPIVSSRPLREVLAPADAERLGFGRSPDGTPLGPDDFATTTGVSMAIDVDAGDLVAELHVTATLGANRDDVVRVMVADTPKGPARTPGQRMFLGDASSAGYRAFRAGIAEYVALLPPNSHGAANPADKDPVPAPFDNTYNSPEHDAFVTTVKYQRTDDFFTRNIVDGVERARLEQAWTDLFGSWPYHDAYLGMLLDHFKVGDAPRRIADMTPARIAALPAAVRPHVEALRERYVRVQRDLRLAEPGHVSDALAFASRAWRRPLTTQEQATLRGFYRAMRTTRGLDHDGATRALLARILMSPAFLYRLETAPALTEGRLDSWEIASRLSFFLWSSVPDDELRRAAAAGELATPRGIAAQVRRMTADPKARRLSTEFFGQWLGFYHFDQYRGVDTGRFPEFTDAVRTSMYDEAVSTFEYLVRERRPVKEILHADYAFLNTTLATFYGIEAPVTSKDAMQRVPDATRFDKGGALRLGAVLTTTSAPLRTSPVKRGDWVLRRILGTPTPPPPADAGTLPADDKSFEGQTLRQRLAQHKNRAACANCHLRIDPLGFPLEGFDAVGRRRAAYADGVPVDVIGEFRDGSTITATDGLLSHLQRNERLVLTTLARKMIGYALGRNPQASDRPLLAAMVGAGGDATFADLATMIATSRQFRQRVGRGATPPAPAPLPAHAPTTSGTSARAGLP